MSQKFKTINFQKMYQHLSREIPKYNKLIIIDAITKSLVFIKDMYISYIRSTLTTCKLQPIKYTLKYYFLITYKTC